MAHAQKLDFVFRRNWLVHLNRRGRQFSRLLAAEVCASAIVMLDTPCSELVWRVLATHSLRHFPLHFPYRASPCAITFQLESTTSQQHKYVVDMKARMYSPRKIQQIPLRISHITNTTAYIDMRRLTTGILSEKCVVRRFLRCANVIECTYTNLDSTV
jgi:hypothetical protein